MRRAALLLVLVGVRPAEPSGPPNVLLIITDDQRYDSMDFMPRTKARIFDEGIAFSRAYVTTSLCCPSRSSILTGMYAHSHLVQQNDVSLEVPTFVNRLQENGYYTGLFGKYLNSWDGTPRPEFDYWVHSRMYVDPRLNVNGAWIKASGYATYILRDYALDFLDTAASRGEPFALIFAPANPHEPADPAPGDETLYADRLPHRPPSYDEPDISDKPAWLQAYPRITWSTALADDAIYLKQLRSLNAADVAIESLLVRLTDQGRLDDTLVIFLSDNGYLWGEHRLRRTKVRLYEESVRVPFAIRYPPLAAQPRVEGALVANIDIAPTIYDLVGLPVPAGVDGRSLVPLLGGASPSWREDLLLETWPHGLAPEPYHSEAIHTDRWVYIDNSADRAELYDLDGDPYQLENQADNPAYGAVLSDLRARLTVAHATMAADDSSYAFTYDGWRGVADPMASGGGYRAASTAGRTVLFRTSKETTEVGLISYRGPDQGLALVTIDGGGRGILDLYAPAPEYHYERTYEGLPLGIHEVLVEVLGSRSAASAGREVRIDAFREEGYLFEDLTGRVVYGNWPATVEPRAHDGGFRASAATDASVSFHFTGSGFTWVTALGPGFGQAEVSVDGSVAATVDLYDTLTRWQHPVMIPDLLT